ncbi:hypothetical protein QJS10_CPB18g00068 [Acorus calamus]|uniref:Ribosomal protein L34Ae n=1 Tax=Acorus calamus TaxID=4465 RepID=A0AAV9CM21_ACOCL|nr:hypothetical protein QJS10_CPB18g00068 [Acorus calamus]
MNFFKAKKLVRFTKLKPQKDPNPENNVDPSLDGSLKSESPPTDPPPKSNTANNGAAEEEDEDDDDDFITNEVKRRLKELRRNSFMVLIPEEEPSPVEEAQEETSSSGWKESEEVESGYPLIGFDAFYDKYCERMLFFDKMSAQQLQEPVCRNTPSPSPKFASKKLALSLRNLSFKKREDPQDEVEHLQFEQQQQQYNPYLNLEIAYVARLCLTWEALHCQYTQLCHKISSQPENPAGYSCAAQKFQQFQVLLQRFIENEPFEQCPRVEIYARTRNSLPMLLQVPSLRGQDDCDNIPVLATDMRKIIEECILTFRCFLKMDKKKSGGVLHLFRGHNQVVSSLQQIQASLDKKEIRLKDIYRKKNGWKKKTWPATPEEAELLIGLIDIKVILRVLRMAAVTKEQLLWCEEKMSKLDVTEGKLQRDGSPVLFPC